MSERPRRSLDARALRIDQRIVGDGSRPQEPARTRSRRHSTFDPVTHTRFAAIGRYVGADLRAYEGPQGQGLFKALDPLLPAATGESPWPHPEPAFYR